MQPRGPEALEPCFWGPYPIRRAVSRGAGQTTNPPTHPPRPPSFHPWLRASPSRPPTAPLTAPPTGHRSRKPEHHISFVWNLPGTFHHLLAPPQALLQPPTPSRPLPPHVSAQMSPSQSPLATSWGHPHTSPIIMPFSALHTICQAGTEFLRLSPEHCLSRPLECQRVRSLMCYGPPPSSLVPRCLHGPHSHVPELLATGPG